MLRPIATAEAAKVNVEELNALDALLDKMSDEAGDKRTEGDLIEFVTGISETLRTGNDVILFEQAL